MDKAPKLFNAVKKVVQGDRKNSYIGTDYSSPTAKNTFIVISVPDNDLNPGLTRALSIFAKNNVNVINMESRLSHRDDVYEYLFECDSSAPKLCIAMDELKQICTHFRVTSRNYAGTSKQSIPWFPRRIRDLDRFANQVLMYGEELDCDHPGFTDQAYRDRRKYFSDIAYNYKTGQKLPHVQYTAIEIQTWGAVFSKLKELYPTHACREFNQILPLLVKNCGYREDNIPQFEDVSNFLKDCTGFTLRPVSGLLSSRDFLAGLAFRVFHATQYIRHHALPIYTPEPDVCHELLGHVPMFADPEFAQFSQEIGLASLGAPDEYVEKLAACYFFTVEFGLCRQDNGLRVFGAGILSSFGELQYCLSDKPERKEFDPEVTGATTFPISEYQPLYFVSDSIEAAKEKMIKFANQVPRNFGVRYDAYTQTIEVLDSKKQLNTLMASINRDFSTLQDAFEKMGK